MDTGFQPPANLTPLALLVLPDGNVVVGSAAAGRQILRLLPGGALDPAFVAPPLAPPGNSTAIVRALARQPDGRIVIAGRFTQVGPLVSSHAARLLADGTPDGSFSTQLFQPTGNVVAVAVQPNGRVLLAGAPIFIPQAATPSVYRLLADGSPDLTFASSQGPDHGNRNWGTSRVLVQADGAIVVAGGFGSVGGLPTSGLARLLDANVLSARRAVKSDRLQIWPVPAHDYLQLSFDAATRPALVRLLNVWGQTVRTCASPRTEMDVNVSGLASGIYLIQVEYFDAPPITKQILVQ